MGWWEAIRDRYIKPCGFDYIWLDETEPDIDPAKDFSTSVQGTAITTCIPYFTQLQYTKALDVISGTAGGS